jgi:hypothetical protein
VLALPVLALPVLALPELLGLVRLRRARRLDHYDWLILIGCNRLIGCIIGMGIGTGQCVTFAEIGDTIVSHVQIG